jgi:glutaconate CoA-transferase subunit A
LATLVSVREAAAELVRDGDPVALEGFTHLIPFAAGHELIRQRRRNLTLIRITPDLIYDQMTGMGCASRLIFSWGGNPGVGSRHRFRDAIETGWELRVAPNLEITPQPTASELTALRDLQARTAAAHGGAAGVE